MSIAMQVLKIIFTQVLLILCVAKLGLSESLEVGTIYCEEVSKNIQCQVQKVFSAKELENIVASQHSSKRTAVTYSSHYGHRGNQYNSELNYFSFVNSQVEKIPSLFFECYPSIQTLDASGIDLKEIIRDDFKSASKLEYLNLSRNSLTHLENKAFMYLPELRSVDLSHNKISSIHESAFLELSSLFSNIDLSFNEIVKIGMSHFVVIKSIHGLEINLANNFISDFTATNITGGSISESLNLNNNRLEKLHSFPNVDYVNVDNNKLKELYVTKTMSGVSASNNGITELKFDKNLTLEILNLSGNKVSGEIFVELKHADEMRKLDLSNTNLGPLAVDSFAEMKMLDDLNLANSSLSKISFGLFSHQQNLRQLNISQNNLNFIDYHMFTSMDNLTTWDVSGNKLTKLKDYEFFHSIFPKLSLIGLEDNDFSCEYLSKITSSLIKQGIRIKDPLKPEKNQSSIRGIRCLTSQQPDKENLFDEENEKSAVMPNAMAERMKILKSQVDELKLKETNLTNVIVNMQERLANFNQSEVLPASVNSTSTNDVETIIKQILNATAEHQNVSMNQLMHEINEQNLEISKIKADVEKYLKVLKSDVTIKSSSSQFLTKENSNSINGFQISLVVLAVTFFLGLMGLFTYPYIKKYFILNRPTAESRRNSSISTITSIAAFDNSNV